MNNRRYIGVFAAWVLEEDHRRNYLRIERRLLRDAENPFELSDISFISNFRLTKQLTRQLIDRLQPHCNPPLIRSGINFTTKILATLYFLANGSYQNAIGNSMLHNLSQASVSRAVNEIVRLITNILMPEIIKFPMTINEKNTVKQGFFQKWGYRGVIGAIDGTHVHIMPPPTTDIEHQPHLYINRKGKHSINVMLISDAFCKILAVNARYPGSVHDAAIWQMSDIKTFLSQQYERGDQSSHLIGDSGYGVEPWLFTPYHNPAEGTPEFRFNAMHIKARNVIERTNGILKSRFRCLRHDRVLNYHPITAAYIIYACSVLHNMCLNDNRLMEDEIIEIIVNDDEPAGINNAHNYNLGNIARNNYVVQNM